MESAPDEKNPGHVSETFYAEKFKTKKPYIYLK